MPPRAFLSPALGRQWVVGNMRVSQAETDALYGALACALGSTHSTTKVVYQLPPTKGTGSDHENVM
jgi:hypothetical protein